MLVATAYVPWTNDMTARSEGTGGSANNLQNLNYSWDRNGNLSQRQDLIQSLTETFTRELTPHGLTPVEKTQDSEWYRTQPSPDPVKRTIRPQVEYISQS